MAHITGTGIGVYEIIGLVGAGGMGEVYRARKSKLKRALERCGSRMQQYA